MSKRCSSCGVKWAFGSDGLCRTCATVDASTADSKEVAELKSLGIGSASKVRPNAPATAASFQRRTSSDTMNSKPLSSSDNNATTVPSLEMLVGDLDTRLVEANNVGRDFKIAYLTAGNKADPCVIICPGAGATKEEGLFWGRELASNGPFFVVMYDLRGTGGSEPRERWSGTFAAARTTPIEEMERVVGVPHRKRRGEAAEATTDERAGGLRTLATKVHPAPLNGAISNFLPDFDGYAEDAFSVLDELGIERAHFVGLSQGGVLARLAAARHPERVLSVVSCGSATGKLGMMIAAFSAGAEDFYDQLKAAQLYDEDGKPPWGSRRATREEYVPWRSKLLQIIVPGFDAALYEEMAGGSWDTGYMDEAEGAIVALAYESWERQGKGARHLQMLRNNTSIPIMFVHGKKDAVIHVSESQKLFAQTGNCVLELHDWGHNFGPPQHQSALLSRLANFMRRNAGNSRPGQAASRAAAVAAASAIGSDTYSSGVTSDVQANVSDEKTIPELWEAFCSVQTAADTGFAFEVLLDKLGLRHLQGGGLSLFLALKPAVEAAGLNFSQKKLLSDLQGSLLRAQKVVAGLRGVTAPDSAAATAAAQETASKGTNGGFGFNEALVCGAGPVGLRAAVELALLGFRVTVIEKRPNFSRANILTFWDETMSDMLALGVKSYFPSLKPTGNQKVLGTRQIQVCLLKTLLLFGGVVRYGQEICGLLPPDGDGGKWRASFRPYTKHKRAAETDAQAKEAAAREWAGSAPSTVNEAGAAAAAATEFQKAKDYNGKESANLETWEVEKAWIDGQAAAATVQSSEAGTSVSGAGPVAFDAYIIAEGGWSDSTRRLGFTKSVDIFKPVFGLVANLKYNPEDLKERNMRSQIHFVLERDWPLNNCPIQAEFIEYLKGETHFFALVVSKQNHYKDQTDAHLDKMTPEQRAAIPDEVIEHMRMASRQKGLLEMGVFRKSYASGQACLATDNVDMERLHQMVRDITQEMGLPPTTEFFATNPVQLFDFSRRARCVDPVRVLCPADASSGAPEPRVLSPAEFLRREGGGEQALVLPVGDALQEPIWTQGLGINRGFHTAMNQAYACLLARETTTNPLDAAVRTSCAVHEAVCKMKWGEGHSGLAGSGSGYIGLKPFKEWDTRPSSRLPVK